MLSRTSRAYALAAVAALTLAACGADAQPPDDGDPGQTAEPSPETVDPAGDDPEPVAPAVTVLASFYPLQFVAERVGGEYVEVSSLTPPGAEAHDLELAPAHLRALGEADLVVYLAGFQPAVDDAVAARAPQRLVEAGELVGVEIDEDDDHGHSHDDDHAHEDDDDHGHSHSHDPENDPHFWLDPTLLAEVAGPVAEALADADPDRAAVYAENSDRLVAELHALDEAFAAGLASCERDHVVVAHEAFGFLTERYGLVQVGVSGIDPEAEPSPARIREIRDVVATEDVTTIFSEVLLNPRVTEVLADDLGLATDVLDPVESQADPAADYLDVMESNLSALRTALGCA